MYQPYCDGATHIVREMKMKKVVITVVPAAIVISNNTNINCFDKSSISSMSIIMKIKIKMKIVALVIVLIVWTIVAQGPIISLKGTNSDDNDNNISMHH